jgi:DNA invertase Pin-like site-specific DNA recombinase
VSNGVRQGAEPPPCRTSSRRAVDAVDHPLLILQGRALALKLRRDAGVTAAPTFYVESESAIHEKNEKREKIRALMSEVRKGDLVLCDKVDRWSRDPEFTYRSIR